MIDDHYDKAADLAALLDQQITPEQAAGEIVLALAQLHAQLSIARSLGLLADQSKATPGLQVYGCIYCLKSESEHGSDIDSHGFTPLLP